MCAFVCNCGVQCECVCMQYASVCAQVCVCVSYTNILIARIDTSTLPIAKLKSLIAKINIYNRQIEN